MEEKLMSLAKSRRFWCAVIAFSMLIFAPLEFSLGAAMLGSAWIVGDSIRATKLVLLLALCPAIAVTGCPKCGIQTQAIAQEIADVHDMCREATVRIRNGNSMGSGTIFREAGDHYYVLTNAHVAGTQLGNSVQIELWKAGRQSRPVPGVTVAVAYIPRAYRDIAVVRIDKQSLGSYEPPVVPLADEQDSFNYQNIFSVGCPAGRWPTAFNGFALRRNQSGGDTIHFVPMPAGGRSGSAIFDVLEGQPKIIGLIAWRSSDDGGHSLDGRGESHGYGIAMTHNEVWAGLSGQQTTSSLILVPPDGVLPVSTKGETEEIGLPKATKPGESIFPDDDGEVVLRYNDPAAMPKRNLDSAASIPPGVPVTGTAEDIMLLYQDPVRSEPLNQPPPLSLASNHDHSFCPYCGEATSRGGSCPNGRCPQRRPQYQQQDKGGKLFPSMPDDRQERRQERRDERPEWLGGDPDDDGDRGLNRFRLERDSWLDTIGGMIWKIAFFGLLLVLILIFAVGLLVRWIGKKLLPAAVEVIKSTNKSDE